MPAERKGEIILALLLGPRQWFSKFPDQDKFLSSYGPGPVNSADFSSYLLGKQSLFHESFGITMGSVTS